MPFKKVSIIEKRITNSKIKKRYYMCLKLSICEFKYKTWTIYINPEILRFHEKDENNYAQILLISNDFCFTLNHAIPQACLNYPNVSAEFECGFQNYLSKLIRLPYHSRNQHNIQHYFDGEQKKNILELREIVKHFKGAQGFLHYIRNDLKYLNHVPHNCGGGLSIGSRWTHCVLDNPPMWKKYWMLYKYDLLFPIKNHTLFYQKIAPIITKMRRGLICDTPYYKKMMMLPSIKWNFFVKMKERNKRFELIMNIIINNFNKKLMKKTFNKMKIYSVEKTTISSSINEIKNINETLDCLIIHLNNL